MDYFMPTRLYAGDDCIAQHQDELWSLGTSCVIIANSQAARLSGALADVERTLTSRGIEFFVWDDVIENPPVATCMEAGRLAAMRSVQFVLGIGGGSALDAAKAVAVFSANPDLDEDRFYAKEWTCSPLPIVLVGTTAGTGSEVTKVSVLTDKAHRKHSIHDDRLYATIAFGDSRYTRSCPRSVALSCGVDVLAHAAESYFSHKADEISRAFSVRAIRLAASALAELSAGENLDDTRLRDLYEASILGGLAINTTGTCFPHNVGYYLTETYGVPHGFASAIFLPKMLDHANAYDPSYLNAFCDEVGLITPELTGLIEACLPSFDIRMTEDEVAAALPRWANNGSVNNTRADITVDTIHEMLSSMFVRQ